MAYLKSRLQSHKQIPLMDFQSIKRYLEFRKNPVPHILPWEPNVLTMPRGDGWSNVKLLSSISAGVNNKLPMFISILE